MSEPKMCVHCEEDVQYENSHLCKDCLNNLIKTQRTIRRLFLASFWTSSELAEEELLKELGTACRRELEITKHDPNLRAMNEEAV